MRLTRSWRTRARRGRLCCHADWLRRRITRRSPCPSGTETVAPPAFGRSLKSRSAPRETETIVGMGPSSCSSSECQPTGLIGKVCEAGVVAGPCRAAEVVDQPGNTWMPRGRFVVGLSVGVPRRSEPSRQAWNGMCPPVHGLVVLLPRDFSHELGQEVVGASGRKPSWYELETVG